MKKRFILRTVFSAAICIFITLSFSMAHPGRTDSNGGHYNRSTGEYHYHHGYSAHQHINGVCPYDFNDKTGSNSGSSSSSSKKDDANSAAQTPKPSVTAAPSPSPTPFIAASQAKVIETAKHELTGSEKTAIVLFIIFVVIPCGYMIYATIDMHKQERLVALPSKDPPEYEIIDIIDCAESCNTTSNNTPKLPFGVEIGPDGLPKEQGANGWGKRFTFYVSKSGKAYHQSPHCTKGANLRIHACLVGNRKPCEKCHPLLPDLSWFCNYNYTKYAYTQYRVESLPQRKQALPQSKPMETRKPEQKPYWVKVNTGFDENGDPILETIYADDPKELNRKIKEKMIRGASLQLYENHGFQGPAERPE